MIKETYLKFKEELTKRNFQKAEELFKIGYDKSIELLNKKIADYEQFDMKNEDEKYAVLFIFDNLRGLWAEGEFDLAYQVCNDMYILVDDPKIKEMFKMFSYGLDNDIDINEFMQTYVDNSKIDDEFPMFFVNFKNNITELFPPKDEDDFIGI